jgi:hypothetical protein
MEWISVKDDKPEYYKDVLVYINSGIRIAWRGNDGEKDMWTIFPTDILIHPEFWMPLPEPPKQ